MEFPKRLCIFAAALALGASSAEAQFAQYTSPGGPGEATRTGGKAALEQAMADARWHLGPLRLAPRFGLEQAGYVDNVYNSADSAAGKVSDFTATVTAGLTAYLPTGSDVFWVAEASPRYIWWQKEAERRQSAGTYSLGALGYFNRFRLEAAVGADEAQGIESPESLQQTVTRRERARLATGLRLSGKTELWASASEVRVKNTAQGVDDPRVPDFAALDRTERQAAGGVAWQASDALRLALGYEWTKSEPAAGARDLGNTATAPRLDATLVGRRVDLDLALAYRSYEPQEGSLFVAVERLGGSYQATWRTPSQRLALQLYGGVQPSLALSSAYAFIEQRRTGVAATLVAGRRTRLTAFGESGQNRYEPVAGVTGRTDDLTSWGVRAAVDVALLQVSVQADRTSISSSLPGLDRELTNIRFGIALSGRDLLWD